MATAQVWNVTEAFAHEDGWMWNPRAVQATMDVQRLRPLLSTRMQPLLLIWEEYLDHVFCTQEEIIFFFSLYWMWKNLCSSGAERNSWVAEMSYGARTVLLKEMLVFLLFWLFEAKIIFPRVSQVLLIRSGTNFHQNTINPGCFARYPVCRATCWRYLCWWGSV